MGVYKRGDIFWIDYYSHGQRVREAVSGSRRDAEAALAERRTDIRRGAFHRIAKRERITFAEMVDLYRIEKAEKRSLKRDETSFKHLLPVFEFRYLDQITTKDIEAYKHERRIRVWGGTVNRELALLKCLFNIAIRLNHVSKNPVKGAKFFPESPKIKRDHVLSGPEIHSVIQAAAPHLRPILTVAIYTGLRKSDILGLRPTNIDFEKNAINVWMLKTTEPVAIPIFESLKPTLQQAVDAAGADAEYLFTSFRPKRDGTYSKFGDIKNAFKGALKRSGLAEKGYTFHDIRRTFATTLHNLGAPIIVISKLLGHKSVLTTIKYLHVNENDQRKAIDKLGAALDPFLGNGLETVTKQSQVFEAAPVNHSLPS